MYYCFRIIEEGQDVGGDGEGTSLAMSWQWLQVGDGDMRVHSSILLLGMFEIFHNQMFKNINTKQWSREEWSLQEPVKDGLEGIFRGSDFPLPSSQDPFASPSLLPCLIFRNILQKNPNELFGQPNRTRERVIVHQPHKRRPG